MTDLSDKLAIFAKVLAAFAARLADIADTRAELDAREDELLRARDVVTRMVEIEEGGEPPKPPEPPIGQQLAAAEPPPQPRRRGRPRKLQQLTAADIPTVPAETLRIVEIDTTRPVPDIGGDTPSGEGSAPPSDAHTRDGAEDRGAPVAADPFHDFREAGREAARKGKPCHPDALWSQTKKDAYLHGYHEQLGLSERRSA